MLSLLLSPVPTKLPFPGGRAGSQAGSQSSTRQGRSNRGASVKRSSPMRRLDRFNQRIGRIQDRFGQQERGSGTDRLAGVRRRAPTPDINVQDAETARFIPPSEGMTTDGLSPTGGGGQGPLTDPNAPPGEITPENTLRNQRIGLSGLGDPNQRMRLGGGVQSGITGAADRLNAIADRVRGSEPQVQANTQFLDNLRSSSLAQLQGAGQGVREQAGNVSDVASQLQALGGQGVQDFNRENVTRRLFESQLPLLQQQFDDSLQQASRRVAAQGITGSGIANDQFGDVVEDTQTKRQSLLGQLTAQAAQQAMADRLGAFRAQTGALQGAGGLFGQAGGLEGQAGQLGQQALRGATGVGQLGLGREQAADEAQMGRFDLEGNLAASGGNLLGRLGQLQLGQGSQDLRAQQFASQNALNRRRALVGERDFENRLARQAMNDRAQQMGFLQQGFGSQSLPIGAIGQAAQTGLFGANEFGSNAGAIGSQLGQLAQQGAAQPGGIGGFLQRLLGGGGGGVDLSGLGEIVSGGGVTQPLDAGGGAGPQGGGSIPNTTPVNPGPSPTRFLDFQSPEIHFDPNQLPQ